MALPVLDGNQSATTLSSVVTGGEHIVAHSVVCLGSTAIANITNAVSGSVVSVSNFPASQSTTFGAVTGSVSVLNFPSTQTIAGTVTANVNLISDQAGGNSPVVFGVPGADVNTIRTVIYSSANSSFGNDQGAPVDSENPLPVCGTVTAIIGNTVTIGTYNATYQTGSVLAAGSNISIIGGYRTDDSSAFPISVTSQGRIRVFDIQNSVTIGSLPAISGTVTVGNNNFNIKAITVQDGSNFFYITNAANYRLFSPTGASKTLNNIFGATPSWIVAFSDSVTWVSDSGTEVSYFHDGTQWTLDDLTTPAGTLALNGSVFITNVSGVSGINILNGFTATQLGPPLVDSGATRVQIYSSTVTAAAPNGSLTTRFGTPTTANTAFATSAVTNANRKYLLIQNVTTGSNVITVGIGFTPTTTQGIQLTAGAGITFESSYIPTGQIFVLSSVTASNFTILEA